MWDIVPPHYKEETSERGKNARQLTITHWKFVISKWHVREGILKGGKYDMAGVGIAWD